MARGRKPHSISKRMCSILNLLSKRLVLFLLLLLLLALLLVLVLLPVIPLLLLLVLLLILLILVLLLLLLLVVILVLIILLVLLLVLLLVVITLLLLLQVEQTFLPYTYRGVERTKHCSVRASEVLLTNYHSNLPSISSASDAPTFHMW